MALKNRAPHQSSPAPHLAKRVLWHLKDHVIPHERNNHIPHLLRHRVLLGYSIVLVLLKSLLLVVAVVFPSASLYSAAITPNNVVDLTNEARKNSGLSDLHLQRQLTAAAQAKAEDMMKRHYFSHQGPSGESPWLWLKQSNYPYRVAGENLAIHFTTAETLEQGWLTSPSHRKNILDPRFKDIGIGVAQGTYDDVDSTIVVQLFAEPKQLPTQKPKTSPSIATSSSPTIVATKPQDITVEATTSVSGPGVLGMQDPAPQEQSAPVPETRIFPGSKGVTIQIKDPLAVSVVGYTGNQQFTFTQDTTSSKQWVAQVAYQNLPNASTGKQDVVITAASNDGTLTTQSLGSILPNSSVNHVFKLDDVPGEAPKLFGILAVEGLGDTVRSVYIYSIIGIVSVLFITLLLKAERRHLPVAAHSFFVACIALFLSWI